MAGRGFNGTSQRMTAGGTTQLDGISTAFVGAAWVRSVTHTNFRDICTRRRLSGTDIIWSLWQEAVSGQFGGGVQWSGGWRVGPATTGLTLGQWYLVLWCSTRSESPAIAVFDTTGAEVFFGQSGTAPGAGETILASGQELRFASNGNATQWANVELGPVAYWSTIAPFGSRSSGAIRPAVGHMFRIIPAADTPVWEWEPLGAGIERELNLTASSFSEFGTPTEVMGPPIGSWFRRRREPDQRTTLWFAAGLPSPVDADHPAAAVVGLGVLGLLPQPTTAEAIGTVALMVAGQVPPASSLELEAAWRLTVAGAVQASTAGDAAATVRLQVGGALGPASARDLPATVSSGGPAVSCSLGEPTDAALAASVRLGVSGVSGAPTDAPTATTVGLGVPAVLVAPGSPVSTTAVVSLLVLGVVGPPTTVDLTSGYGGVTVFAGLVAVAAGTPGRRGRTRFT